MIKLNKNKTSHYFYLILKIFADSDFVFYTPEAKRHSKLLRKKTFLFAYCFLVKKVKINVSYCPSLFEHFKHSSLCLISPLLSKAGQCPSRIIHSRPFLAKDYLSKLEIYINVRYLCT
jgi:hypothetical protein